MLKEEMSPDESAIDAPALMSHLASRATRHQDYIRSKIPMDIGRLVSCDDILQDAWAKMFQDIDRVRLPDTETLDRWACTVINRAIINTCRRLRRMKRGRAHNTLQDHDRQAKSFNLLMNHLVSGQKTPSRELSSKEAIRALRLALASLPEERQRAVILCHLEGQSRQKVATAMNKTPAAVNSLVYRGIQDLRECLGSASRFFSDAR